MILSWDIQGTGVLVSSITSSFTLSTNVFLPFGLGVIIEFSVLVFRSRLHVSYVSVGQSQGELMISILGSLNNNFLAGNT